MILASVKISPKALILFKRHWSLSLSYLTNLNKICTADFKKLDFNDR